MSEPSKSWPETWSASQQAFFRAMLPTPTTDGTANAPPMTPVQAQFAELQGTWQESIERWTEFVKDGSDPSHLTAKALKKMFAPARWGAGVQGAFDTGLQEDLEGPKYATLWDMDRKLAELHQLSLKRDQDVAAFTNIVQRAWNAAFQRFSKSLAGTPEKAPTTWRGLTDQWLAVVNETLIEAHRTDDFVQAQSRMMRSASDYRLQERKLAESWCEACHIPTRSEMDEMQRLVTELRRRVRILERRDAPLLDSTGAAPASRKPRAASVKSRRSSPN